MFVRAEHLWLAPQPESHYRHTGVRGILDVSTACCRDTDLQYENTVTQSVAILARETGFQRILRENPPSVPPATDASFVQRAEEVP